MIHSLLTFIINLLLFVVLLRSKFEKPTKLLLLSVAVLGVLNAALWLLGVK
jgi:hypothetical protein